MVWGFNVRRDIFKRGEFDRWVPTPRGAQGFVSRMGHLIFDDRLAPPRRVELLPYTLGRYAMASGYRLSRPSVRRLRRPHRCRACGDALGDREPRLRAGRAGSGRAQPDGLRDVFPEKRPFFLEDSKTFVLPYGQFPLFNSRRIGQAPGRFALRPATPSSASPIRRRSLGRRS